MTNYNKRHLIAALLLAIYLPTVMMTSLHTHSDALEYSKDCHWCQMHMSHPAHFKAASGLWHECQYCHFLSIFYTYTEPAAVIAETSFSCPMIVAYESRIATVLLGTPSLRAPPHIG